MNDTANFESTGLPAVPQDCQILILCEDFAAYARAAEVCRRLMDQFGGELDFAIKCWNFLELADAHCRRSALKIAGAADLILLAMHGIKLPPVLDDWLAAIPETRFRADGALVLVWDGLGSSAAAIEKIFSRLEQLAGRIGMDFVPLTSGPVDSINQVFHDEQWLVAATQAENLQRTPCDHWGLNE